MAHNCLDWSSNPPTRKIPLLVLTRGDDQVYAPVPQEFKTLEQVARKEFNLGDAKIFFSSSCVNLCNDRPARITESTWEHLSPFIGCVTVGVLRPIPDDPESRPRQDRDVAREAPSTASEVTGKQRESTSQGTLPSSSDQPDGHENDPSEQGLGSSAGDAVRDQQDGPLDHGKDHDMHTGPRENAWEEEGSAVLPPRSRIRHRAVVPEGEDEGSSEESERERKVPAKSQVPPVASPPKPTQSSKEIKKEKDGYQRSQRDSLHESDETLHRPNKRIKQEKDANESENRSDPHEEAPPPAEMQPEHALTQTQTEPSEKLTIRVAHRLSKQESKFTVKGTTSVTKVLAGVCKSFHLNVNRTSLYLIVSTEEDGEEENLFPCDKHDSIARAGADRDVESRFLVKVAGEA